MATLTENLVLSEEHAMDTAHQATTLTIQVLQVCQLAERQICGQTYGVDLLLEGGFVHVTRSNGNTKGNGLLLGFAGHVLPNGNGRVDTTPVLEKSANRPSRSLGGNKNDIDVRRDLDFGQILEHGGESVREVEGLALGELGLDSGPGFGLRGVREKVHDNGTL